MSDLENAVYYVGAEIEKTPAYGKKTLYVVGHRSHTTILDYAKDQQCKHIRLASRNSWKRNKQLPELLNDIFALGLYATVEYPILEHDYITDLLGDLMSHHLFIPLVNCEISNLQNLGRNFSVKFSDYGEHKSNIGVWCHTAHELGAINALTMWEEYEHFTVLETRADAKDKQAIRNQSSKADSVDLAKLKQEQDAKNRSSDLTDEDLAKVLNAYMSKG